MHFYGVNYVELMLFNRKRLANLFGVCAKTIDNMIKDGELPPADYSIRKRQILLWKQETIQTSLDANNKANQSSIVQD